jgi:hypothetical protein
MIRKIEVRGSSPEERMTGAGRAVEDLAPGESIEIHSATIVSVHRDAAGRLTSSWTTRSGYTETTLTAASILAEYASQNNTSWIYAGDGSNLRYWQGLSEKWHDQTEQPVVVYEAATNAEEIAGNRDLVYRDAPRDRDDLSGRNWGAGGS